MTQVTITEANRFSTFVKSKRSDDYRDLVAWQQWFVQRGIPAVIASTSSGYALYRQGLIEIDIHETETAVTTSQQRSHS